MLQGYRRRIRIVPEGLEPLAGTRNRKKQPPPIKLYSIILDPALNKKVHLILYFLGFSHIPAEADAESV